MIFKDEAFLTAVADAGAGSFFIEDYTNQLADKAWKEFKEIEKKVVVENMDYLKSWDCLMSS